MDVRFEPLSDHTGTSVEGVVQEKGDLLSAVPPELGTPIRTWKVSSLPDATWLRLRLEMSNPGWTMLTVLVPSVKPAADDVTVTSPV